MKINTTGYYGTTLQPESVEESALIIKLIDDYPTFLRKHIILTDSTYTLLAELIPSDEHRKCNNFSEISEIREMDKISQINKKITDMLTKIILTSPDEQRKFESEYFCEPIIFKDTPEPDPKPKPDSKPDPIITAHCTDFKKYGYLKDSEQPYVHKCNFCTNNYPNCGGNPHFIEEIIPTAPVGDLIYECDKFNPKPDPTQEEIQGALLMLYIYGDFSNDEDYEYFPAFMSQLTRNFSEEWKL